MWRSNLSPIFSLATADPWPLVEPALAPEPWGEVTDIRIVSSELKDPELERKLVARIRMFRFEDKDVEAMTTTKPIEFFPA